MPISVTGLVSSYFVQFSFFFNISSILKTVCLSQFAFWFLHGILGIWLSLIRYCPPLFSLVLLFVLVFEFWIFSFVQNDLGVLIHTCIQMIIFSKFSWLSKSVSSLAYIRFINCHVILFAFCFIHFCLTSVYKSVKYGLKHV